ncbi:glycosyltransferase family 2 protein [Paracoccaceae bacterium GXU_MW_L88]
MFWRRAPKPVTRYALKPPTPAPDRAGLAIVTIAKGEAPFLAEWLAFHLAGGARHIYLYDDEDGAAQREIAEKFERVTVIPWRINLETREGQRLSRQPMAYAHAIQSFGADYRWMAFIDVDEFLVTVTAQNYDEALAPLAHLRHLLLPWRMFGRNGVGARPASTLDAFTTRAKDGYGGEAAKCKNLLDPCDCTVIGVHDARTASHDKRGFNDAGVRLEEARPCIEEMSFATFALHHYYTRSDADFQAKLKRGGFGDKSDYVRNVTARAESIEADTVEDRSAIAARERFKAQPSSASRSISISNHSSSEAASFS